MKSLIGKLRPPASPQAAMPAPQAAPQAMAAPPRNNMTLQQMMGDKLMNIPQSQPGGEPVTLRSLGMQGPVMGGMAHHQPGFVPPKHAWKPKPAPAPAPVKQATKVVYRDRKDEWDGTNDSGGW